MILLQVTVLIPRNNFTTTYRSSRPEVFLEISQNSQEKTLVSETFFNCQLERVQHRKG